MRWVRNNPGKAAGVSALLVLLVAVLLRGALGGSGTSADAPGAVPLATPTTTPSNSLTAVPTPVPTPTEAPAPPLTFPGATAGGPVTVGRSKFDGLKGQSRSQSIPSHHVVLSLWSDHKLPFVIYNIPTSRDHPGGQSTDLGRTWSLSTTVYGKPDYAQLFTRSGFEGYPITCQITVDGRVTARLTSDGPWGKIFCQG